MERIGGGEISIAHYYEQNGDLMRDPEMTFAVDNKKQTLTPLTYTQDNMGLYQDVYDDNGNLKEQIDKRGNKWEYEYNKNNWMTKAKDPYGNITEYKYDALGRLEKTISPLQAVGGKFEEQRYDPIGRLTMSIDAEGNQTKYEYDITIGKNIITTVAIVKFNEYIMTVAIMTRIIVLSTSRSCWNTKRRIVSTSDVQRCMVSPV